MSKSILIYLLFTVISTGIMAQSIDDIKDLVGKNQWDKAKEAVDKHLAIEKNSKKGEENNSENYRHSTGKVESEIVEDVRES